MKSDRKESGAVIFDMDGVIADTEPLYVEVYRKIYKSLGLAFTHSEYNKLVGMSANGIWGYLKKRHSIETIERDFVKMEAKLKYQILKDSPISSIKGVIEVIKALRERRVSVAIASGSNTKNILLVLEKLKLKNSFEIVIGGEKVKRGKPDPEIFLRVVHMLGKRSDRCLVVEDSVNGIKAAQAAGMRCVLYVAAHHSVPTGIKADKVIKRFSIDTFEQFLRWLQ